MASEPCADIQAQIIDEFQMFDDWMERYKYIIEVGGSLPEIAPEFKTDKYKVQGCQSQVWLHSHFRDGKVYFQAGSDASIVRGLIALALRIYSGHSPEEILATPPNFIEQIGLGENLSMTRSNGLRAVIKQVKLYALGYRALQAAT